MYNFLVKVSFFPFFDNWIQCKDNTATLPFALLICHNHILREQNDNQLEWMEKSNELKKKKQAKKSGKKNRRWSKEKWKLALKNGNVWMYEIFCPD